MPLCTSDFRPSEKRAGLLHSYSSLFWYTASKQLILWFWAKPIYQSGVSSTSHLLGTLFWYFLRIFCAPKLYVHMYFSYTLMNTVTFLAACVIRKQVLLKWERIAVFYSGAMWHNSEVQCHAKWSDGSWTLKRSFRSWVIQLRLAKCWSCPRYFKSRTKARGCSFHLPALSICKLIGIEHYPKNSVRPYEFHPVLQQLFSDYGFFQNFFFCCALFTCMEYVSSSS